MAQVKIGDTVKVHYTGTLKEGKEFDSSKGRDPLQFALGTGTVIPGFEEAVEGMAKGDKKSVAIPFDKAYGPRKEEMVFEVEKKQFNADIDPEIGQQLEVKREGMQPLFVTVKDISETKVTLDANHPLAGADLTFEIEVIEIV
ncbi:MAG: peptidylprolyl isomerase [Candidatus Ancaeobacter aquaticus]|nr:peptidylprolyl isomerase [Candidatus Ancaeobacter aquaticus]